MLRATMLKLLKNKLFIYGAIMELFFALLIFVDYPMRKIFNDYSVSPRNGVILSYLFFIFSGLIITYFLIYRLSRKNKDVIKNNFKMIIFFFILFQITLLFIPPIGSADIYNYIYRTKVLTHYHENPFLIPPSTFSSDPLFNLTFERGKNTPLIYGPLWLIIAIVPTILSNGTVFFGVLFFKILAILFNIISGFLIFKILAKIKPEYKYLGFALYAFNPLLLFEIANNGHNDIAMIFFVILGLYFFSKNKYYLSVIALIASILIKFITILLLPILVLIILNNKKSLAKKLKFFILSLLLFFIIIYAAYFAFGNTIEIITGVSLQNKVYSLISMGPLPFLLYTLKINIDLIKKITIIIFLTLYSGVMVKILISKEKKIVDTVKYFFLIPSLYLLTISTWLMPWYFIWILPFAIMLSRFKTIFIIICWGLFAYTSLAYPLFYILLIIGFAYFLIYKNVFSNFKFSLKN